MKRKIIITESQFSKIEEDLKYWNVSDANPNKNKYEMGVELEEEVTSIPIYKDNNPHKSIYEKMRMEFPDTPEYVLQDYYRNIILMRAPGHRPAIKDILNMYNGDPIPYIKGDGNGWWYNYLKGPWKLQVLNVNPMDFDGRTVRAFEQRDFGNINAYNVPKDEERMETQKGLRRDDGMNEPVIILQNPDGTYQLVEGWHRTMSILKMGDKPTEDYYDEDDYNDELWDEETPTELKDWNKVKLRAFVAPNPDFKEKKIKITETQYSRIFLGEQVIPKKPEVDLSSNLLPSDYYNDKVKNFTPPFERAQQQWKSLGAENPKTGRNKIPDSIVKEYKEKSELAYNNIKEKYGLIRKSEKDSELSWDDQVRIYGDTEQGGLAQSLKQSGLVFRDGGYRTSTYKTTNEKEAEELNKNEDIQNFNTIVNYNYNIDQQKSLIPQYCKKPDLTKTYYKFICGSGECDDVPDYKWKTLKATRKKYDGKFGWYYSDPKAGRMKYGYYLAYRANPGQNPFDHCNNKTHQGVWVYELDKIGPHCACLNEDSKNNRANHQYMGELGTYDSDLIMGLNKKIIDYELANRPGFWESLGNFVDDCIGDYHCMLDIASIVSLAIPGVGLAVSAGLDFLNAAAYGIEAATTKNVDDRNSAIIAGLLTSVGGFAGGGIKQTRKIVKYGSKNPKIYKYADEVAERIKKELPNIKKVPKNSNLIGQDLITPELAKIYKETAEKYGLKEGDFLIANDLLQELGKIDLDVAEKYLKAMKDLDSKVKRGNLMLVGKDTKFQKMLLENNGDVLTTLDKYLKKVARKEAVMEASLFTAMTVAMEQPSVQEWIGEKVNYLKHYGKTNVRSLVEKEGYNWDYTKKVFGTDNKLDENELLRQAWLEGWRPYPKGVKEPTEKHLEDSISWLEKNPKYLTKTRKNQIKAAIKSKVQSSQFSGEPETEIMTNKKDEDGNYKTITVGVYSDESASQVTDDDWDF